MREIDRQFAAKEFVAGRYDVDRALTLATPQVTSVEQAARQRRPEMTAEVMASLGPIEA